MILLENSSTLLFDSSSTDRKTIDTQLEYQVKIGNAQKIGTPKNLIEAHQTEARIGVSNKQITSQLLLIWMLGRIMLKLMIRVIHELVLILSMHQMINWTNIKILNYFTKKLLERNYLILSTVLLIWTINILFKSSI